MTALTQHSRDPAVPGALTALVARGVINSEQREAILTELGLDGAEPGPARRRRTLGEVLVEAGLYAGSALVLAAVVAMVAQSWEDLTTIMRITVLAGAALAAGASGAAVSRGALPGSPRRRLAGVLMSAAAGTAGGAVALAVGDSELAGVAGLATAVVVMVAAQLLASSAVTEIGMFAATLALVNVAGEVLLGPSDGRYVEPTTAERLLPVASITFGLAWSLAVARRLMHRELAVALGMLVAVTTALPLAADEQTRAVGLAIMATIAAVGLWRFLAEGYWPWLAGCIGAVTGFVFFAVGGGQRQALAFLVAGVVLLASSGLGLRSARRRRSHLRGEAPDAAAPDARAP